MLSHARTVTKRREPREPAPLLERADELAVIDGALRAAAGGAGAAVVVEGPPGIGKTELLRAAADRAREQRMLVLSARGGELERTLSFAVVRQLFEPVVAATGRRERDRLLAGAAGHAQAVVDPSETPATAVDPSAALHGLYRLTVNLSSDRPLLLVVDDLHWCDPESVSSLAYVARRIDDLPVALVLGTRPSRPGADEQPLDLLRASGRLRRVEPAPLSAAAVGELAGARLGEQVDEPFGDACHAATGGNPFFVTELLRELQEDGVAGTADSVRVIDGLTPRAVVEATLARLGRMPRNARAVAEAVALLEPNAELRWVAALTGLDAEDVVRAADALVELGMLRSVAPCRFAHSILRSAVESETPPGRRGMLHRKAARALSATGLPPEAAAAHLMRTPPSGEPWVVSTLRQAARRASARGAPGGAVAPLERALAECPPRSTRVELLLDLGNAERDLRRQATERLREALALAEQPDQTAAAALALTHALFAEGAVEEAYEVAREVADRAGADDHLPALLELRALLLVLSGPAGKLTERARHEAALACLKLDGSPGAGAVHASLALHALVTCGHRDRVADLAERAVAELGGSLGFGPAGRKSPGMAFLWIDDLDRAEDVFSGAIGDASRLGLAGRAEGYAALRGYTRHRRGDLAAAAADVEPVLAAAGAGAAVPAPGALIAVVTRVLLLVDGGRPEAAEALARDAAVPPALERLPTVALLRHAEAAARRAQGRFAEAAATLTRVREVCEATGWDAPNIIAWRSELALALRGGDRHDEGLELARDELRLAEQCGVERARGVALRALGLLEGGDAGLRRLAEAEQALTRSAARLELGWASYELGAALRRAKRRSEARAPLQRALDLAVACGARLLADRAREELASLGARQRNVMLSGIESLTPSEQRVCRLAADGLTNGAIAQALFVSRKTVETHLRSSYRKLDIGSRAQLPQTLGASSRG